jgi:hypothetical protein
MYARIDDTLPAPTRRSPGCPTKRSGSISRRSYGATCTSPVLSWRYVIAVARMLMSSLA